MGLIPWRGKQREPVTTEAPSLASLRGEIDRLFDTFVREPFGSLEWPFAGERGWIPAVDLAEDDREVTVRAEVPGMKPEDLDVTISGSQLVLSGEKKQAAASEGKDFYHTESRYGAFQRSIPLPQEVDPENVEAEYAHGVLTVRLKKCPSAVARRIDVRAGGQASPGSPPPGAAGDRPAPQPG